MKEITGDYADTVAYLARLFGVKKLGQYDLNGYIIRYSGKSYIDRSSLIQSDQFPSEDEADDLASISIEVETIKGRPFIKLDFTRYRVVCSDESRIPEALEFISVLERSMFRYF